MTLTQGGGLGHSPQFVDGGTPIPEPAKAPYADASGGIAERFRHHDKPAPRGMTLVEYTADYARALADVLDGNFNPDDPTQAAALEASLDQLDESGIRLRDKVQAVVGAARQLRMYATELAKDRADMEKRELLYVKEAEWLENNTLACMNAAGVDRFEHGRFTVRVQTNPPKCEVVDESLVPAGFLRHIPEKVIPERWEVNKTAVNEAAKAGEMVPGTLVTRSQKLVVNT